MRSRASLAHELGHLILHGNVNHEDLEDKETLDTIENQAWHFAGCFLMPESTIANEVYSTNLDNLILVKQRWLVSMAMLIMRVAKIGLITDSQRARAFQNMAKNNYLKKEPLDDVIPHEKSELLNKIIDFLDDNNLSKKDNTYFSLGLPDDILMQTVGFKKTQNENINNVIRVKFN